MKLLQKLKINKQADVPPLTKHPENNTLMTAGFFRPDNTFFPWISILSFDWYT
jgi:hypothetical protein